MPLFHVSEGSNLEVFYPRPDPNGKLGDVVWAIDEEHLPNYLLPRDCPRVTFAAGPRTNGDDRVRFLSCAAARRVIAIESAWLAPAAGQSLCLYRMPPAGFERIDDCAGYYVARDPVRPESVETIPSALDALLRRDVELRVLGNLWPLRDLVVQSTLEYSIIRMRNAQPRPAAKPVRIVPYDAQWPEQFREIQGRLWAAISGLAIRIEHVGSTSVPGLAAKPVIDIDILIDSRDRLPAVVARLAELGYEHRGDLGIPDRDAFRPPDGPPPHHLYVCPAESLALRNHLVFRDHLRHHSEDAAEYAALKSRLAESFAHDRERYTEGKTEFVLSILSRYE
jgi:GrpB-like predicted nucleotidyltransferase (UPF0157 family)